MSAPEVGVGEASSRHTSDPWQVEACSRTLGSTLADRGFGRKGGGTGLVSVGGKVEKEQRAPAGEGEERDTSSKGASRYPQFTTQHTAQTGGVVTTTGREAGTGLIRGGEEKASARNASVCGEKEEETCRRGAVVEGLSGTETLELWRWRVGRPYCEQSTLAGLW